MLSTVAVEDAAPTVSVVVVVVAPAAVLLFAGRTLVSFRCLPFRLLLCPDTDKCQFRSSSSLPNHPRPAGK